MNMIDEVQRKRHAARSFRLAVGVSTLIGVLVLAVPLAAPALDGYAFLRFPLGLFIAAQGVVIGLIAIIYWASNRQDRLDRRHGLTNEL
ncbi:MAG TPA: sodium/substrate symporter small subunit [Hyphomicrobiales bacterium]|nr:sodium/substrate symporter small subunit [Hyphomicrobiales bacterium]